MNLISDGLGIIPARSITNQRYRLDRRAKRCLAVREEDDHRRRLPIYLPVAGSVEMRSRAGGHHELQAEDRAEEPS